MSSRLDHTRVSFQEHNEYMREFRKAHGNVALVNLPRSKEPSLVDITRPISMSQIDMDLGGLRLPANATDWTFSLPLPKVASYKLFWN